MGTVPDAVKRLVDRFDLGRKVFLSGDYKEEQLPEAKTPCEQESLQRQIDADDKAINTLVYERHGPDGRQYRSAVLEARG
jgi:hypothetical protein